MRSRTWLPPSVACIISRVLSPLNSVPPYAKTGGAAQLLIQVVVTTAAACGTPNTKEAAAAEAAASVTSLCIFPSAIGGPSTIVSLLASNENTAERVLWLLNAGFRRSCNPGRSRASLQAHPRNLLPSRDRFLAGNVDNAGDGPPAGRNRNAITRVGVNGTRREIQFFP